MDYTNAKIDVITSRINELYKKSKEEGLNEAEKEEQAHLISSFYFSLFKVYNFYMQCYIINMCIYI